MLELIIERKNKTKKVALVENGKLIEYYEDDGNKKRNEENIYVGTIKDVLQGMQSAFIDIGTEKNGFIHLKDVLPKVNEKEQKKEEENIEIKDAIKVGDKLLVQIKKDSDDKKGARVSTHINLPSKYVVLMPNTNIITISKKIEEQKEQKRLITIMKNNLPQNTGVIIRTSAENKSEEELVQDLNYVLGKWKQIQKKYNKGNVKSPTLIYKSPDVEEKIIIDTFSKGLNKITVNSKKEYEDIINLQNENEQFKNIEIILKPNEDIMDCYDIKKQVEKIQDRKIWLKCGGFITIDKTEALTAIDVNTGKYTGKKNLEETIYKVNEEATHEIAKQVRLRDIGGIIIIDYIDMNDLKNKEKIEELLKQKLKEDRAKTQVEGFTKLDLMEFTRKHICNHNN